MKNYKKYFIKAIRKSFPERANRLLKDTEEHYAIISVDTKFAATSANPMDKRLNVCAYFLAFIMTLDDQGMTFEEIRKMCLEVVTE